MADKQPRHVALINVKDYDRSEFNAYWNIGVDGDDGEGYRWVARIMSYAPIAYDWQNARHAAWPAGVERPAFPPAPGIPQSVYESLPEQAIQGMSRARVRVMQEEWRMACAQVYESHPKPVHLIAEKIGVADTRDEADTAAQQWVLAEMAKPERKRAVSPESGHAVALGPFGMLWEIGEKLSQWLFALAFNQTLRSNRATEIRDFIDGGAGAGLFRIYDGTRPATCGTATTLLAEITHQDPCGTISNGVLTFSGTPLSDTSANATGTATWFRQVDSTGTCAVDGDVGTSGSDLNLNSTSISSGQEVQLTSAAYTEGNA